MNNTLNTDFFSFLQEGDSVELRIARSKGLLVKQFLRYTIEPTDSNEFYGNTGLLEFKTGEREIVITLLTRMDGIPEVLDFFTHWLHFFPERFVQRLTLSTTNTYSAQGKVVYTATCYKGSNT